MAHNFVGVDASLASPHEGNDTEGAEFVASTDDCDPCVGAFAANGGDADVIFRAIEPDVEQGVVTALRKQIGQAPVGVGTHHQVDKGRALRERIAQMLGHAT